jgi:hypothetical protein
MQVAFLSPGALACLFEKSLKRFTGLQLLKLVADTEQQEALREARRKNPVHHLPLEG